MLAFTFGKVNDNVMSADMFCQAYTKGWLGLPTRKPEMLFVLNKRALY